MAKTVFVAHPISGDVEGNLRKVAAICRVIHNPGLIPIFPSFARRQYLDDEGARVLAEEVNREYFRRGMVDEIWFYGNRMSDGMKREAVAAHFFGIPLVGKSPATKLGLSEMAVELEMARCVHEHKAASSTPGDYVCRDCGQRLITDEDTGEIVEYDLEVFQLE